MGPKGCKKKNKDWNLAPPPNSKWVIPASFAASTAGKKSSINTLPPKTDWNPSLKVVSMTSMYFLAIVGLLSTVIAAFYYLRIIKIIYFDQEKEKYDEDHSPWLRFSLTLSTILVLIYFIFPSQLNEVVSRINII